MPWSARRWLRRDSLGTFPCASRRDDTGDAGWHVDVSFGYEAPDFLDWRANIRSRGRALLMLFLFSDVGDDDAPTRIRVGSHLEIARTLAPAGDAGRSLRELAADGFAGTAHCREVTASGAAGTVYLCHPFLVQPRSAPRLAAALPASRRLPASPAGSIQHCDAPSRHAIPWRSR